LFRINREQPVRVVGWEPHSERKHVRYFAGVAVTIEAVAGAPCKVFCVVKLSAY
jgi:hypothetical protein